MQKRSTSINQPYVLAGLQLSSFSASSDYGPIIHNDFIAVFPKPAMVGYDVTMECFAFGK